MTRVMNLLGADLPSVLLAAQPDNPSGFWESHELVEIHDAMLASAGSSWEDISPLSPAWFGSDAAREFEQQVAALLRRDFAGSSLFVIKDPRISRLVPFWLRVLQGLGIRPAFVITVRNPLEIAASLKQRNGFLPARSLLLWLRHMLEAERETRDHARSIVSYERLLESWRSVADTIASDLGLTWPRRHDADGEIEAFLSAAHRHHTHDIDEVNTRPDVTEWVRQAYAALRTAAEGGGLALPILDSVRADLEVADLAFGPLLAESPRGRAGAREELRAARILLKARDADLAQLRGELEATAARLARREFERARVSQELEATAARLARRESERARVSQELEATKKALTAEQAKAAMTHTDLAATKATLAAEQATLAAEQAKAATIRAELAATNGTLAAERADSAMVRAELEAARTALAGAETSLSGLRHELEAAQQALVESQSLVDGSRLESAALRASGQTLVDSRSWKLTQPLRQLIEGLSYVGDIGLARTASLLLKREFVRQFRLRRQLALIERSQIFDASWYLAQYPDVALTHVEPVQHYLLVGAPTGRDPHPLFDSSWYLERYPDVRRARMNPLVHYILRGAMEGRYPHPRYEREARAPA